MKILIPVSDPKADDSAALMYAAENGHYKCVKLLIPVSDPKADDSAALIYAAENVHYECVKLLIPVSDLVNVCRTAILLRNRVDESQLARTTRGLLAERIMSF